MSGRWVIEPGQDALLSAMLGAGAELPLGCRFEGASVDRSLVVAKYACAAGATRIELRHRSDAPPSAPRTASFALAAPEGFAPPAELIEAIGARVRAQEASFRWTLEGRAVQRTPPRIEAAHTPAHAALGGAGFALAFALVFALAVRLSFWARTRAPAGDAPPPSRRGLLVGALAACAATFAWLELRFATSPVDGDLVRDLRMAAECLAGLACDHGPPTSFPGIVQGALWTRFLALCQLSGVAPTGLSAILHALDGLSAAVVFVAARRRMGGPHAAWTALFWALLTPLVVEAPTLWNPSLAPLPLALFCASLAGLAEGGSLALAAAAGGALALAIDCHVVFALLVPFLVAAAAARGRRPALAVVAALSALGGVLLLDSRAAWIANAHALAAMGAAAPAAAVLVVAAVAGGVARPRLRAAPGAAFGGALLGAAGVLSAGAALALLMRGTPAPRYLAPALPALALAGGVALVFVARALNMKNRIGPRGEQGLRVAAGAACLAAAQATHHARAGWSLRDVERAAPSVYARVPTYRALRQRLQMRSRSVLAAMVLFQPKTPAPPPTGDREALFLLKAAKRRPRPDGPWIATVDLGESVALLGRIRPFLDRTHMEACFAPLDAPAGEGGCIAAGFDDAPGPDEETAQEEALPEMRAAREAFPPGLLQGYAGVHETFVVALRPEAGPARRIVVLDEDPRWRIEAVDGAAYRGALPARDVIVEGRPGEGTLVLGRRIPPGAGVSNRYWPPSTAELPETDAALGDAIDAGWLE